MNTLKIIPLVLLAAGLASGTAHARGGHGGMGNGAMIPPAPAQRTEARTQHRETQRVQARDGSHAGNAERNALREQTRTETREAVRSEGDSLPGR